ncbi:MAG: hypothetical protein ABL868_08220, partial [Sulfuriferula sp.]
MNTLTLFTIGTLTTALLSSGSLLAREMKSGAPMQDGYQQLAQADNVNQQNLRERPRTMSQEERRLMQDTGFSGRSRMSDESGRNSSYGRGFEARQMQQAAGASGHGSAGGGFGSAGGGLFTFDSNAGTLAITASTTLTNATTTTFGINSETFTDLTGTGLQNVGGALTLNATGDWTGTLDGQEGSYYLANGFSTTSANYWETQQTARTADDLTNNSIEDLNDVAAITENFGDLLYWNGSAW